MNGYVKIEIDKPNSKKKLNIETLIIIVILILVFTSPFYIYKKIELPNGTLMSMHRITGEISVKLPNDEIAHFRKDNPFYKEMLIVFKDY